jgi:type II secretory pathway component PulF
MRKKSASPTIITFAKVIGGAILFAWIVALLIQAGGGVVVVSLLDLFVNGWALYAFLRYRESRQDELFQVLSAAIDRQVPLAPAVHSFLLDQPRLHYSPFVRMCMVVGLVAVYIFILPLYAFCRLFIGWQSFDTLVINFADRLEEGESLSEALQSVPGVACREVRLAAEVGEATGALGACLKGADRERWSAAWLEVAPRLLYPFLVLSLVSTVVTFLMLVIVPKFKKIFMEFGEQLPPITMALIDSWYIVSEFSAFFFLAFVLGLVVVFAVVFYPGVRWRTPFIGQLYRWGIQGEILRTLGRLLAAGQTVPQALGFLARSSVLPYEVTTRLNAASVDVEEGQPLNDALNRAGLLPTPMSGLLHTSERVGTLPWALVELGDNLAARAFRVVRRLSLAVAPILVVAVGSLVGFVVLAMFLPLIQLLTRLSE